MKKHCNYLNGIGFNGSCLTCGRDTGANNTTIDSEFCSITCEKISRGYDINGREEEEKFDKVLEILEKTFDSMKAKGVTP